MRKKQKTNIIESMKKAIRTWLFKGVNVGTSDLSTVFSTSVSGYESKQFDYKTAADEGFKGHPFVYRCIMEIANRCASVPWMVFTKDAEDQDTPLPEHALNSLMRQPNEYESLAEFLRAFVIHLNVSGNAYLYLGDTTLMNPSAPGKDVPKKLTWLRPDRITIAENYGTLEYHYNIDGAVTILPQEQIVHWKYLDPTRDYYGLSPLYPAANIIDCDRDAILWNKNMFRNQARPAGLLSTDQAMDPESMADAQNSIQQNWQGPDNAFKPFIMDSGMHFERTQLTPQEADYLQLRLVNRGEICTALGVPPIIVGIMDDATYSNFEQAEKTFWYQTIIPTLRLFRDLFNYKITNKFGDKIFVDYDLSNIDSLNESHDSRVQRAVMSYNAGLISLNEARDMINLQPLEKGDFFVMAGGMQFAYSTEGVDIEDIKAQRIAMVEDEHEEVIIEEDEPDMENEEDLVKSTIKQIDVKILDLDNDQSREKYQERIDKAREAMVDIFLPKWQKLEENVYNEVAKSIKTADNNQVTDILKKVRYQHVKDVKKYYSDLYNLALDRFGNMALTDVLGKASFDPTESSLQDWIYETTGEKIVAVSDETIRRVKVIITQGLAEGLSMADIALTISEIGEIATFYRAQRIAWTEIVAASNAGSFQAVLQSGVGNKVKKVWLATRDSRTRDTHASADGQKVDMMGFFNVGGYEMKFPGDTSRGAPAKEVVQCRCTQYYDTSAVGGLVAPGFSYDA